MKTEKKHIDKTEIRVSILLPSLFLDAEEIIWHHSPWVLRGTKSASSELRWSADWAKNHDISRCLTSIVEDFSVWEGVKP